MGFWSTVKDGTLAITGTIYELGDTLALGALPNTIQGVQISNVGGSGTEGSIAQQTADALAQIAASTGQVLPNVVQPTAQALPQWGTYLGQGVGNTAQYSLQGVGTGVGSLIGDVGQGATKGFAMPLILIVGGAAVLLIILSRPGASSSIRAVRG